MNKKKLVSLCLVLALAITAAIGGTMAYFTDTDAETNEFTVGKVSIDLKEEFGPDKELMPGKDVNKDAWIVNDGENEAWVWAEVLIPRILDDGIVNSPEAPGLQNSLHVNYPGMYSYGHAQNTNADAKWYNANLSQLWKHQSNDNGLEYGYKGTETVGGVEYNVYVKLYTEKLAKGEKTSNFLDKVYMDTKVEQCTKENCECGGNGFILYDGNTCYTGDWQVLVRAYGMQAEGFDTVEAAYAKYDGEYPAEKE